MSPNDDPRVLKGEAHTDWPVGLQFVSPSAGTIVHAGGTVEVCVEPLPGFNPVRVLIGGPDAAECAADAPYSVTLRIPLDLEMLGDAALWAIGIDANDARCCAEMLPITVETTAVLRSIECQPKEFFFPKFVSTYPITVVGMYNDGVSRKVISGSLGIMFSSDDESIATVNPVGVVRAVGVGSTVIRASLGAMSSAMRVAVVGVFVPGDFNDDGVVDAQDLRRLLLHAGPCLGCPGDLNADGVIDAADIGLLFREWTGRH
jgi:hypothetical protein